MTRTRIKICGVTSVDDALAAAEAGADAVGMVLHAPGRRREISLDLGREIALSLPPFVAAAGVVVDLHPMRLRQLLGHVPLGVVQFHGGESKGDVLSAQPTRAVRAVPCDETLDETAAEWAAFRLPNLAGLLIDSPAGGGRGVEPDWSFAEELDRAALPPLILAGGLTPANVGQIVRRLRPFAVDVSSGVEGEDGRKSPELIRAFVAAVRAADGASSL